LKKIKFDIPRGEINQRNQIVLKHSKRVLILSDIHVPYHNQKALNIALNYGLEKKVDTIILNGDVLDWYSVAKYIKDPTKSFLQDEIEKGIKVISEIRKGFKNQKIIFKVGNHDERVEKHIITQCPEFFNLSALKFDSLLNLKQLKIDTVDEKKFIKVGKMTVIHGHEFSCGGGTYLAKTFLKKVDDNVCFGHFHRSDEEFQVDLYNNRKESYAMGCLCELSPDYRPYNNWNLGFGYLEILDNKGNYKFYNHRIINGKIY